MAATWNEPIASVPLPQLPKELQHRILSSAVTLRAQDAAHHHARYGRVLRELGEHVKIAEKWEEDVTYKRLLQAFLTYDHEQPAYSAPPPLPHAVGDAYPNVGDVPHYLNTKVARLLIRIRDNL